MAEGRGNKLHLVLHRNFFNPKTIPPVKKCGFCTFLVKIICENIFLTWNTWIWWAVLLACSNGPLFSCARFWNLSYCFQRPKAAYLFWFIQHIDNCLFSCSLHCFQTWPVWQGRWLRPWGEGAGILLEEDQGQERQIDVKLFDTSIKLKCPQSCRLSFFNYTM